MNNNTIEAHVTSKEARRDSQGTVYRLFCKHCVNAKPETPNDWMELNPSTPTKFFLRHLKVVHGLEVEE